MNNNDYKILYKHYENCLKQHGDSHKGVDWPDKKQADMRYKVMLDIIDKKPCTLLDFGCGLSHLYEFMQKDHIYDNISYTGLDISEKFINASQIKYPNNKYILNDCLQNNLIESYDYIIANGVFTEKREMSYDVMLSFFKSLLIKIFKFTNIAVAFNVMSKQVDWERKDLFHLALDELAWFFHKNNMRNFVIRNDYGLYEYTVYIYK